MRYLLDTNVLIDVSNSVEPLRTIVRGWIQVQDEVAISSIQIAEFFSGVRPMRRWAESDFLGAFALWEVSTRAAIQAGVYRHDFQRMGIQLSLPDVLIAAVARERSAILVTRNVKDFPMTDIRISVV